MNFNCIVRKIGTLIYTCTSDPLKSLSFALHDSCSHDNSLIINFEERKPDPKSVLEKLVYLLMTSCGISSSWHQIFLKYFKLDK